MTITVPKNVIYVLCVMYIDTDGSVVRYKLWDAAGSNLNQQIPLYTGQIIKKNFRFEIWNTSQGATSQSTDVVFYTSKRGGVDYMHGTDSVLVDDDGQVASFACSENGTADHSNVYAGQSYGGGGIYMIEAVGTLTIGASYTWTRGNSYSLKSWDGSEWTEYSDLEPFIAGPWRYYLEGPADTEITTTLTRADYSFTLPLVFESNTVPTANT